VKKEERDVKTYDYKHPNGKVTSYEVETIKVEGKAPVFIFRDSPQNQGPKFCDHWSYRDEITEQHAKQAIKDYNLKPHQIVMFQERPKEWDGDYDKVQFKTLGWDSDKRASIWSECGRTAYTKEQFEKEISSYRMQQQWEKASLPKISEDERREAIKKDQELKR
jgi:hypothetical protein